MFFSSPFLKIATCLLAATVVSAAPGRPSNVPIKPRQTTDKLVFAHFMVRTCAAPQDIKHRISMPDDGMSCYSINTAHS